MVVCVCNRYRDADIREAARSGMTCPREIYASLGRPPRCGRCLEFAAEVIKEAHAAAAATVEPIDALSPASS
jgi:bacterioferritin-associated ferredoxin